MHLHKHQYPAYYQFVRKGKPGKPLRVGPSKVRVSVEEFEGDVYRLSVTGSPWTKNYSQAGIALPPRRRTAGATTMTVGDGLGLTLRDPKGRTLLSSPAGLTLGLCGKAYLFLFDREEGSQFYGMGEKLLGMELSKKRTKFWNTDVWADFHEAAFTKAQCDPLYVSIPYLIVKRGNDFVGLLLDSPCAAFMCTDENVAPVPGGSKARVPCFSLGAEDSQPSLYVVVGPTLAALTRKLQTLVGRTPMPPAWALGYHQCKWGYRNDKDLEDLDRKFRQHKIPCDGLWLDIDYMNGFRVFTFGKENFPRLRKTMAELLRNGRRVVPILDPGVKLEKGYPVYESGHKAGAYCLTAQGTEYVGMVWPGETVFPDYSTKEGRAWWTKQVKAFGENGIYGAWLDMNDPATGMVENMTMRFNKGREAHETYHSQYALGMAKASREGFIAAHPKERPFLLCRSGFTGSSKYTAIWTGDNCPNYAYLKGSISCTLNLALSGVPFNGPDIGGFGGNTTPELLTAWLKTCFLFPVCRNHAILNGNRREPWMFGPRVEKVLKHYIVSRYKLRPYLYNLYVEQEATGEAILRPLFYDFADSEKLPLGRIDDQFMVGPHVMQAPVVEENQKVRDVLLPAGQAWFSAMDGAWVAGGRKVKATPAAMQTPIYVREGAIVPVSTLADHENRFDGRKVEFHVFLRPGSAVESETAYSFDDGLSFDYQKGKRSKLEIRAGAGANRTLSLETRYLAKGFGECDTRFVLYGDFRLVLLNGRPMTPKRAKGWWTLAGTAQDCYIVD